MFLGLSPTTRHGQPYRGRIAPSPTGLLHLGHAATFLQAHERALTAGGTLVFRNDDLDRQRCRPTFLQAALEDLRWIGIDWQEGPNRSGPHAPYSQSERIPLYQQAFEDLRAAGWIYPCLCSRRDVASALAAPHATTTGDLYPGTCRPALPTAAQIPRAGVNWRFRIPEPESLAFHDLHWGPQHTVAGTDFGDFLVWRKDDCPAYQLATVVDDHAMQITEVVRGADLIPSTFQQLLLYRALQLPPPAFFHTALLCDASGNRLAKRSNSLAIETLRRAGVTPDQIRTLIEQTPTQAVDSP